MKKILVPTDFSSFALKALFYAAGIVKKAGGEIYLLHVCKQLNHRYSRYENLIKEYNDQEVRELSGKLTHIQEELGQEGIRVHTFLYNGEITESVLWLAHKNEADLIVMGTQGATGLKTAILGTKTAAVIQESPVPVITVPYNYIWKEPQQILLAVNDADEGPELFSPVFQLATLFGAHIKIAVFSDETAEGVVVIGHSRTIDQIHKRLSSHYGVNTLEMVHLSGREFQQTLQEYIDANQVDLLVMVTHKRKFIQSLFKFSMTRQMAYHTTIPLLSFQGMRS